MHWKELKLLRESEPFVTSEKGNSMVPLIHSGQDHELTPVTSDEVKVGDIVFCKVRSSYYTHLVKARKTQNGKIFFLIGNNHGGINGWTTKVFGKVTKIHKR